MEISAKVRVQNQVEKNSDFLSKAPIPDLGQTRNKQTMFIRTKTLSWVMKEFISLAMMGYKKDDVVPSKHKITQWEDTNNSLKRDISRSTKSSTRCK